MFIKKSCSIIMAFVFTLTVVIHDAACAAPAASEVLQNTVLPANAYDIAFKDHAKITSSVDFGGDTVVLNIQDFHMHPQVQVNISAVIDILVKDHNVKNVYVEGGYGKINADLLSNIQDENFRNNILNDLLHSGVITGAEYYSAVNGMKDFLIGIEDEKAHKENIKRLGRILSRRDFYGEKLNVLRNDLSFLQQKYFNSENKKLAKLINRHKEGKINSVKYYTALFEYLKNNAKFTAGEYGPIVTSYMSDYPNICLFLHFGKLQKNLDKKRINADLAKLISALKEILPYREYVKLLEQTDNLGNIYQLPDYLGQLPEEFKSKYFTPEITKFIELTGKYKRINPVEMLTEERLLTEKIRIALSVNKTELEISFLSDFFVYFEDYLKASISADDHSYLTAKFEKFQNVWEKYSFYNKPMLDLREDLKLLEEYYGVNDDRNEIFLKHMFKTAEAETGAKTAGVFNEPVSKIIKDKKNVIVCVTGGYHTKGLTDLLSSKNISYAVLTPNISDGGDIGAIHKNYENTALEQSGILSEGLQLTLFSQILNGEAGPEFMQFAAKLFASAAKTLENMPYSEAKVEELLQYMNEAVGENYKFERDIKFPEKITLKSADGRYSENFIEIYGRKGKISVKNIYARNTADKVFLKDSGKLLSGKETAGFLENFTKTLNIASLDFGAGVFVPKIYPAAESVFDWAAKKGLYINIDEINGIDFDAELYGLSDILLSENPDTAKLPTDLQKAKVRSYIKAEKYKGNAFYAAGLLNEMLFLDEETLARRIVLADERIEKGYLDDIVPAFKNFLGINSDEDFEEFKKKAAASSVFHENEKIRDVLKQLGFAGVKSGKIKAIEEFTPNEKLLIFEWFIGNSKDSKASVVESPVITAAAAKLRAKIAEEKKKEEEKDKKIEAADEIAEKSEAQNLFEEEVERIMKNKGKYTEGVDYVQSDDGEILPIGEKFMGKLRSAVNFATKPGTAVFYSRLKDAAAKYANKNKKQTLEMTDDGKYFDSLKIWDKFGEKASHIYWDMFSEKFAEQATGEVTLFLNNPAQTSVYIIREWPSIHLNDNISKIVIRDYGRIIGSDYGAVALGEEFFEKDGFMPDILLSGILARSGKTPSEILSEVYSKVGYVPSMEESTIEFADREERENAEKNLFDLSEPGINELIDFEALGFDAGTGASGIQIIGDMDLYEYRLRKGIKITINDSAWIVIRQAPAENALQIYVETDSKLKTKNLSDKINSMLKDGFRLDRTASQSSRKTKWYDLALISELINFGKIQDLLKYTGKKAVDVEYRYINGLENYINAYKKTGRQDLKKSNRLEVLIINQMPENPENLGFKNTGLKVNGSIVWESLTTGTLVMYARNADANDIAKAATDIMPVVLKRETGSSEFSAVAVDERREHTKAFKYLDNGMLVMTKRFYDETFRFYKNSPEAAAEKIINEQKAEKAAFGRNFIMDLSRIKRDKMQKALEAYNKSGNRQIALPLDYFEGKTEAEISSFVSEMSKNGTRVFAVIDENSSLNEFDSERLKTALLKYNFSGFLLKKDDKIISFRDYFSESENKVSEINDFADENELVNKINSSDEDSVKVIDIENYVSLADGGIRDISERIDSFVGLFGDKILKFFNGNISRDAAVKTALAFDMPVVPDNVNERALANIMDNEPSKAVNERLAGMLKVNEIPEFKIYLKRIDENAANDEERIKLKYAFLSTIAKKAKVKADLKDRQFPAGFDTKELEELMILSALSKRAADNRFISELYEAESAESRYAAVKTLAAGLNMTEGEAAAATIYQLILAFSEQRTGIRSVPSETISIESVSQILKAA